MCNLVGCTSTNFFFVNLNNKLGHLLPKLFLFIVKFIRKLSQPFCFVKKVTVKICIFENFCLLFVHNFVNNSYLLLYDVMYYTFNIHGRFIVQDKVLGAERLLIVLPLPSTCPINPSQTTRETLLELFRGLQHPYIHPVLDIEFWELTAGIITPLNPAGSLKDLIYDSVWHEEYDPKYNKRGNGLPLGTVSIKIIFVRVF